MTSGATNSITQSAMAVERRTPKASPLANALRQAGAGVSALVRLLLHSANAMVFLGFTYAAALIATTFLKHLNRLLKAQLLG